MDGSMVSGIPLKVSLARRQPQIEPINDATSSAAWATLGKSLYVSVYTFLPFLFFQHQATRKKATIEIKEILFLMTICLTR